MNDIQIYVNSMSGRRISHVMILVKVYVCTEKSIYQTQRTLRMQRLGRNTGR